MRIAVFDVCGTLYRANTTFEFLDFYFQENLKYKFFRKISKSFLGKLLNYPFFRFLKFDVLRYVAIAFLKGETISDVNKAARIFVTQHLAERIQPEIKVLYDKYQKDGYYMILMSGSLDFIISIISEAWGAHDSYSTVLQIKDKKLTGKVAFDQLFNKSHVLDEHYEIIGELIVVSDNASDYQLLKKADTGYAVCNKVKQVTFWQRKNLKNTKLVELL
ncbi:HAD-IB family phosphatase [Pseudoalteromonas sp. Z9A6]|uniref:HAD family hydrolase n=1 Tax=Pseudoalteromonas sp. Z9A6 TaxID=2686352 RepID=UPI0013FDF0D8|nr:HAD-IB family phosphatase [Pseudoalteromonas sp. Z9A6]